MFAYKRALVNRELLTAWSAKFCRFLWPFSRFRSVSLWKLVYNQGCFPCSAPSLLPGNEKTFNTCGLWTVGTIRAAFPILKIVLQEFHYVALSVLKLYCGLNFVILWLLPPSRVVGFSLCRPGWSETSMASVGLSLNTEITGVAHYQTPHLLLSDLVLYILS